MVKCLRITKNLFSLTRVQNLHVTPTAYYRNSGSWDGIMTKPEAEIQGIRIWFLGRSSDFSLLHIIQTSSAVHPTSHAVGTGGPLPVGQEAGAWNEPLISTKCSDQEQRTYTSTPLYVFMAQCTLIVKYIISNKTVKIFHSAQTSKWVYFFSFIHGHDTAQAISYCNGHRLIILHITTISMFSTAHTTAHNWLCAVRNCSNMGYSSASSSHTECISLY